MTPSDRGLLQPSRGETASRNPNGNSKPPKSPDVTRHPAGSERAKTIVRQLRSVGDEPPKKRFKTRAEEREERFKRATAI